MKQIILPIMFVIMILSPCVVKARYYETIWSTSFETEEERNQWTFTDLDGDGNNWMWKSSDTNSGYTAYDGTYSMYSESFTGLGALTPDNIAISNPITIDDYNVNQAIRINWYVAAQDFGSYEEHYNVYLLDGAVSAENIASLLNEDTFLYEETLSEKTRAYYARTYDITERISEIFTQEDTDRTVRIVFRHHDSTDNFALKIDSVSVEKYYKPYEIKKYTFETGLEGWTNIDGDSDGYVWEHKTSSDSTDESNFAGYNSEAAIASASYYNEAIGTLYPENYIVSPKIKLDSKYNIMDLNWYVGASNDAWDQEQYSVYVYSGTEELTKDNIKTKLTDTSVSQLLHNEILSTSEFKLKTVKLDEKFIGKEVQVVFVHHNSYDQDWLKVDDVAMYGYITDGISSGGTEGGDLSGGTNPPTDEVILGDWNGNGSYTLMDLIQYRSYLVNPTEISDEVLARVDLNEDGKINLVDLIAARKLLVGLSIN